MDTEEIVVSDDGRIDHHDVDGRGPTDLSDEVLPEGEQHGDGAGLQVALRSEVPDDEAAVADLVAGLLEELLEIGKRSDTGATIEHPEKGTRLVFQDLELPFLLFFDPALVLISVLISIGWIELSRNSVLRHLQFRFLGVDRGH